MDKALLLAIIGPVGAFIGVAIGALLSWKITRYNSTRQIELQTAIKITEFKQKALGDLRDCMARFQAIGMTPEVDASREREFYEYGTRIELLLSSDEEEYSELQKRMYDLLSAKSTPEKYACNIPYVQVCQAILRRKEAELRELLVAIADERRAGTDSGAPLLSRHLRDLLRS
jgi:hypothetical protein